MKCQVIHRRNMSNDSILCCDVNMMLGPACTDDDIREIISLLREVCIQIFDTE